LAANLYFFIIAKKQGQKTIRNAKMQGQKTIKNAKKQGQKTKKLLHFKKFYVF